MLDVTQWHRKGLLRPGTCFTTTWRRGDDIVASISTMVLDGFVTLRYTLTPRDGQQEEVGYQVARTWTACNYGGRRPWFVCPGVRSGVECRRRVGKLYFLSRYFVCRHCLDLTYTSRRERPHHRELRRAQVIRLRLGGSASMIEPFPLKPKGMHWRTYQRLRDAHDAADRNSMHLASQYFDRLRAWGERQRSGRRRRA